MSKTRPFLLDIDKSLNFCFVDTTEEALGRANFLMRSQLDFDPLSERKAPMAEYSPVVSRHPSSFVFHTAFCGSTLLSRALHSPQRVIALKEPNVLFQLSEASIGLQHSVIAPHIEHALAYLTQPWADAGHIIIKPSNSCNRIIKHMLTSDYDDSVVFMYSTLEEFLVSCLKKLPAAESRLNWMARHLLPGSELEKACDIPRNTDFNIIEACSLVWFVSMEYFSRAIDDSPQSHYMLMPYKALKQNLLHSVIQVGKHCRIPDNFLDEREIGLKLQNDSKIFGKYYSKEDNERSTIAIYDDYGDAIKRGLHWADTYLAKNTRISAVFKGI